MVLIGVVGWWVVLVGGKLVVGRWVVLVGGWCWLVVVGWWVVLVGGGVGWWWCWLVVLVGG